jgi:hypothetical protein
MRASWKLLGTPICFLICLGGCADFSKVDVPTRPVGPQPLAGEFLIETVNFNVLFAVNGGGAADNAITTASTGVSANTKFRLWPAGPQDPQYKFIMTAKGYSLMAPDGGGRATSDAVVADLNGLPSGQYISWAKFRFGRLLDANGHRTVQTSNGDFVTAVGGGGQLTNALHTDARVARSWEYFRVVKCGDLGSGLTYAIHLYNSAFNLNAPGGGGRTNHAIAMGGIDDSARFTFIRQADGSYALRTPNGTNYLTAVGGGGRPFAVDGNLHTDATQVQAWEKFRIVETSTTSPRISATRTMRCQPCSCCSCSTCELSYRLSFVDH